MSDETQQRILEIIGGDTASLLTASGPAAAVATGTEARVQLTTTLAGSPLQLSVSGGTATVCDGPATLTGSTLVVDADAALPAEVTLCVVRPDAGTAAIEVAGTPPVIENIGFAQSFRFAGDTLCQVFSAVESERETTVQAGAEITFADVRVEDPAIGTSLVDLADGDRVLPWNGGTVVDTVAYRNLTVGQSYTVFGELMDQRDGRGTGITALTEFVPTASAGSVEVSFVIPTGYAGTSLVAFEQLRVRAADTETGWTTVAVHEDLADAAQTVTIEAAPITRAPAIGTSLTDSADGDRVLGSAGGTLIDTVAYRNLEPGVQVTLAGKLVDRASGEPTGITGSVTFVPTEANGSVDVTFVVPSGYAGRQLVAFERLFVGDTAAGEPIAVHEDLADPAQTVRIAASTPSTPVDPTPPTEPGEPTEPATPSEPSEPTRPAEPGKPGSAAQPTGLPVTGGALPGLGIGIAGLLLTAGAAALLTRRARAER
ncbi:VaFE repeat-containing surface-anchored protein [Leucobacter chromiireducens]|uniref:VaFE repeat-containing surface-anchored protein n=1 Tax=Leucobacter chromiireducens TaxID=283877 RepID=UPI003D663122